MGGAVIFDLWGTLIYDDPEITPQALAKAAKAYEKAGKVDEAQRANAQLHQKYPDYAGD